MCPDSTLLATTPVFMRDASWHNYPQTSQNYRPRFHFENPRDPALSACGKSVLSDFTAELAGDVKPRRRCMRPGCRQRWEALDREQKEEASDAS